jgi:hypothetical protein
VIDNKYSASWFALLIPKEPRHLLRPAPPTTAVAFGPQSVARRSIISTNRLGAFHLPPIIESATICLPRPRYRRLGQMPEPHHSELNDHPTHSIRCVRSAAAQSLRLGFACGLRQYAVPPPWRRSCLRNSVDAGHMGVLYRTRVSNIEQSLFSVSG